MIWSRTLRELAEKGENVYRVTIPAHKIPKCSGFIFIQEQEDIFSSRLKAENWAATFPDASPIINTEPASDYV